MIRSHVQRSVWVDGFLCAAVLAWMAWLPASLHAQAAADLDDSWVVTISGQTVRVNPDGSFFIRNISAPDLFGAGGPGTPLDGVSDEFVRLTGYSASNGVTHYVFSEPFIVVQDVEIEITNLTFTTTPPPLPVSIQAVPDKPLLVDIGDSAQVTVTATLGDGSTRDVTSRSSWTLYRTSNPAIADVDQEGRVTAMGVGQAFITAANEGASSVARITVTTSTNPLTTIVGFVQDANGVPVAGATVEILGTGLTGVTDANGQYVVNGVPTGVGLFTVAASVTNGVTLVGGTSNIEPVADSLTDAGLITLFDGILWVSLVSGDWNNPDNWSAGRVPGPGENVIISAAPDVVVTHSTGLNVIGSLQSDNRVSVIGGVLDVNGTVQVNNLFSVSGGTLRNATIIPPETTGSVEFAGTAPIPDTTRLENVTLDTEAIVRAANSTFGLQVAVNGLTINSTLNLTVTMILDADTSLQGTGEILITTFGGEGAEAEISNTGGTLTLESGLTIRPVGGNGVIGNIDFPLVNQATILANEPFQPIFVQGNPVRNEGTIVADQGELVVINLTENPGTISATNGTLTLSGTWTGDNVTVVGTMLILEGMFTLAQFEEISRTGGPIVLSGTLDNTGTTLDMEEDWLLANGTIVNGIVQSANASALVLDSQGTLDGVTLDAVCHVPGSTLIVRNGLTVNGLLSVERGRFFSQRSRVEFSGTQTLEGTGLVHVVDGINHIIRPNGGTLTIGAGITVQADVKTTLGGAGSGLINQGTLIANSASTIEITGSSVENQGSIDVRATGGFRPTHLRVSNLAPGTGHISGAGGSVIEISGDFAPDASSSLDIVLAGTDPSDYTQFVITGMATLGGTLNIAIDPSFTPMTADQFSVVTYGSHSGTFNVNGTDLGNGRILVPAYEAAALTFQVQ